MFVDLLEKHDNLVINYEVISDDKDEPANNEQNEEEVTETIVGATTCQIRVQTNSILVNWKSRSAVEPKASPGLIRFIANHFGLHQDATKSVTLYTQYKRGNTTFRCHPSYRGGLPWFDWVMMLYTDPNFPDQQLSCPARLMAIVRDNTDPDNIYHPILQWAENRTMNDSVLFDEYVFTHPLNPDDPSSFNVHPSDSIERPVFVIDCESETEAKVLVAREPEDWGSLFHTIV